MEFSDIKPFVRYVRYLKIEKNSYFPPYIPADARIFYVTEGEGEIEVEGKLQSFGIGSLLFINAGVKYTLLPCEAKYLAINFDFTQNQADVTAPIPPYNAQITEEFKLAERVTFSDTVCFNNCFLFDNCSILAQNLFRLEKEYARKLAFFRQETSGILISVLAHLARFAEQRNTKDSHFNITAVVSYIQNHLSETITNKSIAEIFHYHPNYLSGEFKRTVGMPMHRYLIEARILKASSLIESGQENLTEIANVCGFKDVNYFIRYFKKIIGTTPSKFAKTFKNNG